MRIKIRFTKLSFFNAGALLWFLLQAQCYGQWSTSPVADSGLIVTPGLYSQIVSYDDGSCIISGILNDYIYLQKLDPYGKNIWSQPVLAQYDSAGSQYQYIPLISDNDGGVIFWWADVHGAHCVTYETGTYCYNGALYAQRVDKNGNVRWHAGGINFGPLQGGRKYAYGVTDGASGVIFIVEEDNFGDTGSTNLETVWGARYDANGNKLWQKGYDTVSVMGQIQFDYVKRIGSRVYIQSTSGMKEIDLDGNIISPTIITGRGMLGSERDSVGYYNIYVGSGIDSLGKSYTLGQITKISNSGDSLWNAQYKIHFEPTNGGYAGILNPLIPDHLGGVFFVWSFQDTSGVGRTRAQRIDKNGGHWRNYGLDIHGEEFPMTFSSKGELGLYFFVSGHAQKFDTSGSPLWPDSFTVISDPSNAYFPSLASDNMGGAIISYWTTQGWIKAKHTGRNGSLGIITEVRIDNIILPLSYSLSDNYPNPFNPITRIDYFLPEITDVEIAIFNILGQEIERFHKEHQAPGKYTLEFDLANQPSGVYFYQIKTKNYAQSKKMSYIR
ncbi:MAG: T9SS type A sorting domain-containing protein [Bacteroidota bacterium]